MDILYTTSINPLLTKPGLGPVLGASLATAVYTILKMANYEEVNAGQDSDGTAPVHVKSSALERDDSIRAVSPIMVSGNGMNKSGFVKSTNTVEAGRRVV